MAAMWPLPTSPANPAASLTEHQARKTLAQSLADCEAHLNELRGYQRDADDLTAEDYAGFHRDYDALLTLWQMLVGEQAKT